MLRLNYDELLDNYYEQNFLPFYKTFMQHEWSSFQLKVPVNGNSSSIYKLWTTQDGLEKWFLRKAEFRKNDGNKKNRKTLVEVDDTYEWMWHGYDDEVIEKGRIMEANGKDFFKFSFGKAGNVSVTIKEEAGESIIELMQDEIPGDEKGKIYYHLGCSKGWVFYLANLKSILEGGIDLRNKKMELKDVINS
jgi:uncharacterized protein YndB with AHSA1/START domain